MTYPSDSLELIKIIEGQKRSVIGWLLFPVTIESTAELSDNKEVNSNAQQVTFKAAVLILALFLPGPLFFIFLFFQLAFCTDRGFQSEMLIPLLFALLLTFVVIYRLFLKKSFVYSITIGIKGIMLGSKEYNWSEIEEIAIVKKGIGSNRRVYLGILFRDYSYRRVDIRPFFIWNFSIKLSRLTEYYKKHHQEQTHNIGLAKTGLTNKG